MEARILVADDEQNIRKVLSATLRREGYDVLTASDGEEAIGLLDSGSVQVVVTDLKMPKADGLAVLQHVQDHFPEVPVIIITAHGSIDNAVEALKAGALDYITKPFDQANLIQTIAKAVKTESLSRQDARAEGPRAERYRIIGQTRQMQEIYSVIDKVADTPSTVLISGESGTGKELVAAALHYKSSRARRPFIRINCAAIPRELVESELFGHEKGSFTGAISSKPGRFELADGGSLFLDEIAEIPVEMQVKLLRAIQESEFERVGGLRSISVDVRLIAATNRDLPKEVEAGHFREDLFYRLNVVPVRLPPLRERREDIPLLLEHFLKKTNKRLKRQVKGLSPQANEFLPQYDRPGQMRQLENVVERAVLFCEGQQIEAENLPDEIRLTSKPMAASQEPAADASMKDIVKQATAQLEKDLIVKALAETGGNVTRAARSLGISRKSLQNKMKDFGLRENE